MGISWNTCMGHLISGSHRLERALRARFDNALQTEERYMTKKESIQLFNQLNTAQEEPNIQGRPETGAPVPVKT